MSQSKWDFLEEHKQDIIEGKFLCELWGLEEFEAFEGMDSPLTEKEMIEVFNRFPRDSAAFYESAFETLGLLVEAIVSERTEKAN